MLWCSVGLQRHNHFALSSRLFLVASIVYFQFLFHWQICKHSKATWSSPSSASDLFSWLSSTGCQSLCSANIRYSRNGDVESTNPECGETTSKMHDKNKLLPMALHFRALAWRIFGDSVLSAATDSCRNREARESISCHRTFCPL